MVFDKMAVVYLDFKWLGNGISDPIWNVAICKPTVTIQNPEFGFQIPTVFET